MLYQKYFSDSNYSFLELTNHSEDFTLIWKNSLYSSYTERDPDYPFLCTLDMFTCPPIDMCKNILLLCLKSNPPQPQKSRNSDSVCSDQIRLKTAKLFL